MKRLIFFCLLPLASIAQGGKEFRLEGRLSLNYPFSWVYLSYRNGDARVQDSVKAKDGKFSFRGKIAEPSGAVLAVKYLPYGNLRERREQTTLFLEPARITVTARGNLQKPEVRGSAGHTHLEELAAAKKAFEKESGINSLSVQAFAYEQKGDKVKVDSIEKMLDSLFALQKEEVVLPFFKSHAASPAALSILREYAGYHLDAFKVDPLFALLPPATRQWPSARTFADRLAIARKTGIGRPALEFTQADTLGRPVSLSSFRGQYVLVDFWASWCGPCRRENPNVVANFQRFRDKGFTVLGVSLDRPGERERWITAIYKDSLAWTHVSDLKHWENAVAKLYGVRSIPQNFLVGPDGRILARNLRGEALGAKLAELLGITNKEQGSRNSE